MDIQAATPEDARLILKLYDLRREPVLRKARHWLIFEFNPATAEEFLKIASPSASEENAYYRQVLSYWEMAASFVLAGAVHAELFLKSQGEGLYIFAKFSAFREQVEQKTGRPFMRNTAEMLQKYPLAQELYGNMLKSIQARSAR